MSFGLPQREKIKSYISHSWSVSWPMTLIMFFEFLIGLTDVYIAGRVSKEVQATYGFVMQLHFIFVVIANALTEGTVSVVSRLFTSGNLDELNQTVFFIPCHHRCCWNGPCHGRHIFYPRDYKHFKYSSRTQTSLHSLHQNLCCRLAVSLPSH